MKTASLFHVAIKTSNLELTRCFYRDILGLVEAVRPDFGFPGAWLACPFPGGQAIFHIYAGGPALGNQGQVPTGGGAIDHVSLSCTGFEQYREKFFERGLDWREFVVPGTTLWQLFVYDPSGVQLELTFDGAAEQGGPPDMSEARVYRAGENFFDASRYAGLKY